MLALLMLPALAEPQAAPAQPVSQMSIANTTRLATAESASRSISADNVNSVNANNQPEFWAHADSTLFLLPTRIVALRNQLVTDDSRWRAMQHWLETYLGRKPYNVGEYTKAYALGYHLTGREDYLEQGKELLWNAFFADPNVGWSGYKNRNGFRSAGNRIALSYAWLRFAYTPEQQVIAEQHIATWVEYWLNYTNYQNDFAGFRINDTDEVTAITENLTLLGYLLQQTAAHRQLGEHSLAVADEMLQRFVVDYYMADIMQGGAWAEGSDYSPQTQMHWMRLFLINKELRNLPFPSSYPELTAKAMMQTTLVGFTGIYQYGSVEQGSDYRPVLEDSRYRFAMHLLALLKNSPLLPSFSLWLDQLISLEGHEDISIYPGVESLLFYQKNTGNQQPAAFPNFHLSPGVGLLAASTNGNTDSSNLFLINRHRRVDHEHSDALSFDLAHRGVWITKEVSGYGGGGALSNAHNTILIENATTEGSSNPTGRAAGSGHYRLSYQDPQLVLVSAEAADIYNMSGYYATNYAKAVTRQLALIGNQTLAVFDTVQTFPSQIKDLIKYKPELNLKSGDNYTRQVTVNQLFQGEPEATTNTNQTFRIETDEMIGYFQIAWPEQASIQKVDGRQYWAGATGHAVPENQRKWHLKISPMQPQPHTEILTLFKFEAASGKAPNIYGSDGRDNLRLNRQFAPEATFILNTENNLLNSSHWFGVGFANQQVLVLFSRFPDQQQQSELRLNLPENSQIDTIYISGWVPGASVTIESSQQGKQLIVMPVAEGTASAFKATTEGLLVLSL